MLSAPVRSLLIVSRSCGLLSHKIGCIFKMQKQPSSDLAAFRECFDKAKHIVILTGAGVSAESGVPTFRGAGGLWRKFVAQWSAALAYKVFFKAKGYSVNYMYIGNMVEKGAICSLVTMFSSWSFTEVISRLPVLLSHIIVFETMVNDEKGMAPVAMTIINPGKEIVQAHIAIADCEKRLKAQGRRVVVVTQNIDELHKRAGSENILELHGNLFTTRCTKCQEVRKNYDSPICEALRGKGEPDPNTKDANIPEEQLPRCKKEGCGGLLRPHVVWFGEGLSSEVLDQVDTELENCDLCLVVGTSSVVYPAAMFAPSVASRGVPVAEFNIESTGCTSQFGFHFEGPCGSTLPEALAPTESEPKK